MPPTKLRFVTACQQLLALGVVLALLTPAASVISLDVVREAPASQAAPGAALSAYAAETLRASTVPTAPVDPSVREVPLTAPVGASPKARVEVRRHVASSRPATRGLVGRRTATKSEATAAAANPSSLTSTAAPVEGYGAVGVTWDHGIVPAESAMTVQVRTRTADAWSGWMDLDYDADHGPDPGTAEARAARPGTDALLVGDVDDVQVRVSAAGGAALPPDLKLAVVDPGRAPATALERPALDTGDGAPATPATPAASTGDQSGDQSDDRSDDQSGDEPGDLDLARATYTPKPTIYSRAQWGADEKIRGKSSLHYFEVHAGFVHHTVNANNYTRAQVPGIIRSIYAYHVKSRGWSDIGYNFLVDRFGRIWEGRYGGIDRPVVGAHTQGYNDYAFAMSAIGNYDVAQPSQAMIQAYGALFAWKLSLHGVDASGARQRVGSSYFRAINGHRDAGQTACPGRYLYAKIPQIRALAAKAQRGWAGRELESNLAGSVNPDLILRRASDNQAIILPLGGVSGVTAGATAAGALPRGSTAIATPDMTGDGRGDLLVRDATGAGRLRPGTASGSFGPAAARVLRSMVGRDLVTAVGDLNGDGRNDLVSRDPRTGRLVVLLRTSSGAFSQRRLGSGWGVFNLLAGPGDLTGDGRADLLARDASGRLRLYAGDGRGGFTAGRVVGTGWGAFSTISGFGDFTGDGRADVLARRAQGGAVYVYPSRGNGTFGRPLGPLTGFTGQGPIVGAMPMVGAAAPEVIVQSGTGVRTLVNTGRTEVLPAMATGVSLRGIDAVFNAGDWDRDGYGDMITRTTAGVLQLRRGNGAGRFAAPIQIGTGFGGVSLLAAVGDMTGDGWPDLMGQPKGGAMRLYPGRGTAGFLSNYPAHSAISATAQVPVGRWDADGAPDSLFRTRSGVTLYPGNGPGGLVGKQALKLNLAPYDWVIGISDINAAGGHPSLVVREKATGILYLIPGTATGFGTRRYLADGMKAYNLAG